MKTAIIQKAFVINDRSQLLALKRSDTDVRRPGEWDLPGGWLNQGEALEAGVVREVQEETGLQVSNPELVFSKAEIRTWQEGEDANKQGNCVFLFYVVQAATNDVVLSYEHTVYVWMSLQDAVAEFVYPLHKAALEYVIQNQLINV